MPRYRVVHLQRRPNPQQVSIERVFEQVRRHLPDDLEVEVVVTRHRSGGVLPRIRAALEARRAQGDVTHVVGDVHFLTLLLDRRRTVLTVHDLEWLDRNAGLRALVYRWVWVRLPVLRSAVVTVPSEQTRQDVLRVTGCEPAKVRVIPNPMTAGFTPAPRTTTSSPPVVLLMGTWPTKNVLRSAAALEGLGVHVVVLGRLDDVQRAAVRRADPAAEEHVDLDDDGVVALLRRCDVLLFPSLKEGFGLPVLEAQATGRPVVTSTSPPLPEVSGGAAELVDPLDVADIRRGVQRVLDDDAHREDLVRRGFENVRRYDPARIAALYAAVYAEVYDAATRR